MGDLIETDILAWCQSLPKPYQAPPRTDRPTLPECPGWELQLFPGSLPNRWRVVARRGAQVLNVDKLHASDVEAFNATERWNRP